MEQLPLMHHYPQRELILTAGLFGGLIAEGLVVDSDGSASLSVALRFVLEAIKSANLKMFSFGVHALQQFKHRLHEWPHYTSELLRTPHLSALQPELEHELRSAFIASGGVPQDGAENVRPQVQ
jgi:CCR4-NOT transcription complex subunit 1